eukprot:366260-Chlamydomonas_euryale.AAC.22
MHLHDWRRILPGQEAGCKFGRQPQRAPRQKGVELRALKIRLQDVLQQPRHPCADRSARGRARTGCAGGAAVAADPAGARERHEVFGAAADRQLRRLAQPPPVGLHAGARMQGKRALGVGMLARTRVLRACTCACMCVRAGVCSSSP